MDKLDGNNAPKTPASPEVEPSGVGSQTVDEILRDIMKDDGSYNDSFNDLFARYLGDSAPEPRRPDLSDRTGEARLRSRVEYADDRTDRRFESRRTPGTSDRISEKLSPEVREMYGRETQSSIRPAFTHEGTVKYPSMGVGESEERVVFDAEWEAKAKKEAARLEKVRRENMLKGDSANTRSFRFSSADEKYGRPNINEAFIDPLDDTPITSNRGQQSAQYGKKEDNSFFPAGFSESKRRSNAVDGKTENVALNDGRNRRFGADGATGGIGGRASQEAVLEAFAKDPEQEDAFRNRWKPTVEAAEQRREKQAVEEQRQAAVRRAEKLIAQREQQTAAAEKEHMKTSGPMDLRQFDAGNKFEEIKEPETSTKEAPQRPLSEDARLFPAAERIEAFAQVPERARRESRLQSKDKKKAQNGGRPRQRSQAPAAPRTITRYAEEPVTLVYEPPVPDVPSDPREDPMQSETLLPPPDAVAQTTLSEAEPREEAAAYEAEYDAAYEAPEEAPEEAFIPEEPAPEMLTEVPEEPDETVIPVAEPLPELPAEEVRRKTALRKKKAEDKRSRKERFIENNIPRKGDSAGEIVRKVIRDVSFIALVAALIYLAIYGIKFLERKRQTAQFGDQIKNYENMSDQDLKSLWADIKAQYPDVDFPEGMQVKFSKLYAINNEFVGWLEIPNTNIQTPLLQREDDNYYYLYHDIYKKSSRYGNPYINCDCSMGKEGLSRNTIVYGHNTHDGLMFHQLTNYMNVEGYLKAPIIKLDTLYESTKWKIFAVMLTNATPEGDSGYVFDYLYPEFSSDEAFLAKVDEIYARSMIHTGVDVEAGDKILTLYTCFQNYFKEGRLVILARQLRDGESEKIDESKVYYDENAHFPDAYYNVYATEEAADEDDYEEPAAENRRYDDEDDSPAAEDGGGNADDED